jgi:hypothetical protein
MRRDFVQIVTSNRLFRKSKKVSTVVYLRCKYIREEKLFPLMLDPQAKS